MLMENNIEESLRNILSEISDNQNTFSIDDNEEINLNSIEFIKLIVELENYFGIEFDAEQLIDSNYNTIRKLVTFIKEKL
ncbi:acyl carrier protein [Bacillus pseudomycoides]|nr:acyl carrier protein [Bacillus pseudomycoides]